MEVAQKAKDPRSRIHVIHIIQSIIQGTEMLIKQKWFARDLLVMQLNSDLSPSIKCD